ncbi:MAG: cell wall hydrolase [Methyloligellaceae bacterium]
MAAAPIPLLALGYVAAKPAVYLELQLVFSGETSNHIRQVADAQGAQRNVPDDAGFLFMAQGKGPRADHYNKVRRTTYVGRKPRYMVAALSPIDVEITGAVPKEERVGHVVNRSGKAPRLAPRETVLRELEPPPASDRANAALFLTSLQNTFNYGFPGASAADTAKKPVRLAAATPSKIARGLVFKGETEAEFQVRQRRCLATAIYFEARSEPVRGQLAVAQVIMNRVRSSDYPDTICGVVFQGQWRRNACQFSFACDGIADVPKEQSYWKLANQLAKRVTDGKAWLADVGHATHYHANYVKPRWRRDMDKVKSIGRHIFYRRTGRGVREADASKENPNQGLALAQSG